MVHDEVQVQMSLKNQNIKYVLFFPLEIGVKNSWTTSLLWVEGESGEDSFTIFIFFYIRFSVDVKYTYKQDTCAANENLKCDVAKFFENLANAVFLGTVYLS